MKKTLLSSLICLWIGAISGQELRVSDPYLFMDAGAGAPLYTTYTAALERSRLYGDKGYVMTYDDPGSALTYGSEHGGRFFCVWEINDVVVGRTGEFSKKPVIRASFPDMVLMDYQPWPGLEVNETFFVHSSRVAMVQTHLANHTNDILTISMYPVFDLADSLVVSAYDPEAESYLLNHYETKKRLVSNLGASYPYPVHLRDFFSVIPSSSYGAYTGFTSSVYQEIKTDFYSESRTDALNYRESGPAGFVMLQSRIVLSPGESSTIRYFRGIQDITEEPGTLAAEIEMLKTIDLQPFIDENVRLFSGIPRLEFTDPEDKIVYLSAFNLARGCMLPPEGEAGRNYYVFSREPLWGWGHGHQVLHESLTMLAYVYLDPGSAQNSQRIYMDQQGIDGLIAYRHGPRGAQTYPHKGMPTTSSPFFSWINWEIYQVSHDKAFLEEAYESGVKYTRWLSKNRDTDRDGTLEWGPYGIIENVRDWYNAVFQVSAERYLDVDKEDISDELECLDLSMMVLKEMRSLQSMALELGLTREAKHWQKSADKLVLLVNDRMWDEETGFFYHVNKADHGFSFLSRDLRRQEIIGFLPLWAEAVTPGRADTLIKTLTDPGKFWRKYGVPTLAADDPWYSPYVDYCCKWNGPVWLLWDYLVFDGLVNYGHLDEARELSKRMLDAVKVQLRKNHRFWESYSPDNENLNCPPNYIWDAIIAKLLIKTGSLNPDILRQGD